MCPANRPQHQRGRNTFQRENSRLAARADGLYINRVRIAWDSRSIRVTAATMTMQMAEVWR
jgi:hypothetical protein